MAQFTLKASSNVNEWARGVTNWGKQVEFANVLALTRTAKIIQQREYDEMRRVFDRPTRFTLNSLYVDAATRSKPQATVETKPGFNSVPAGRYLNPQVFGGQRKAKSSEKKVGGYIVPSRYATLDAFGNFPAAQLRKIMSNLKLAGDSNSTNSKASKRKRSNEAYFRSGDIIYRRSAHTVGDGTLRAIIPQLIIVDDTPDYNIRFRFFEVAQTTFDFEYQEEFDKALTFALRTAK